MLLREHLTAKEAGLISLLEDNNNGGKDLYLKGCFIEGDIRNHNQRIYPSAQIKSAVGLIMETIADGQTVLGECDHPEELTINLDRVSHIITEMHLDGNKGVGKMKIIPTPMGQIIRTLVEAGANLGVSSRGSGNVANDGTVSDFEIVTVDIVARPSAPGAYPEAVYEALGYNKNGNKIADLAEAVKHDSAAQKYLTKGIIDWVDDLNLNRSKIK